METHEVSPSDNIRELVSHFLRETARAGETDPSDVFGVKPLMFLIKALRIIGASEAQWNRIADFTLKKGLVIYYRPTLSELVPHVSADMVERIRVHFVCNGELGALMHLTRLRAWRKPSSDEIRGIAVYLHKQRTSSTAPIWQELLELAACTDPVLAQDLGDLHREVQMQEESDDIPF